MHLGGIAKQVALAALLLARGGDIAIAGAQEPDESIRIPANASGPMRKITARDLAGIRDIAAMSVSPDGKAYVILVRQADADRNSYASAWFAGAIDGGPLKFVADGGEARQLMRSDGETSGDMAGSPARWSPDGKSIIFSKKAAGELQIWRAEADGSGSVQITRSAGDVRDYFWSPDGRRILFSAEVSRSERARLAEERSRSGKRLQDFSRMSDAVHSSKPAVPLSPDPEIFAVAPDGTGERAASTEERTLFTDAKTSRYAGWGTWTEFEMEKVSGAFQPAIRSARGAIAWQAKVDSSQQGQLPELKVMASLSGKEADAQECAHAVCRGQIFMDFLWSSDGEELLFSSIVGAAMTDLGLYAWNPRSGRLRTIGWFPDGSLSSCNFVRTQIVCLREERLKPKHVLAIDLKSGRQKIIADVNPEFRRLKLGRIKRIDWPTPLEPGWMNARMTRGYLIYPPDYDPKKSYPLFVDPYSAYGFARGGAGDEHPLLVYAANDILVLSSEFPIEWEMLKTCVTSECTVEATYKPSEGYPHLRSYGAATLAGIDEAKRHANVDLKRVGIGGVSHGAFIPMFMMQMDDRLAALSVGGGGWSRDEYYTSRLQDPWSTTKDPTHAWPKDPTFWEGIDLSYHLDKVEAPILFHFADREVQSGDKLVRDLADARLPFEAFTFFDEYHFKVQPAHRLAIYHRNLDWFRFWLQDVEDEDPSKSEQYARWRKLRKLQCRNPRATRGNYCDELPADRRAQPEPE